MEPRTLLERMFKAAIAAAQPTLCVPPKLPPRPPGRTIVIGAGKASAAMAKAVEDKWRGELSGVVVTRYGYGVPCNRIDIIEAAHPVPDAASVTAARRILDTVKGLSREDLVLCLVSGGGSSLLVAPLRDLTLHDKQAINRALLESGASISEMNCVRRHLSAVKGGRLAAACHPAKVVTLLLSDVPGDEPMDIASGPTVADPTSCADALDVVRRYAVALPPSAAKILQSGLGESVKAGDLRLHGSETRFVATPQMALEAAAAVGREAGWPVHILGDSIEGEARDAANSLRGWRCKWRGTASRSSRPASLLSGGETTVTIRRRGRGGRNVECLLSLAIALQGHKAIHALAGDTDGVDGAEEIAGAYIGPDTLDRAWAAGMKPKDSLADNDGHGFFQRLGQSVITGPTLTNVNDFRAVLVAAGNERIAR